MHVCHPNQQIFRHCLDKLAVQPSGMTTQYHYNKYTCLVIKLQDRHLIHDGR